MKRQRCKFLWDLPWENKTYMLKRSIAANYTRHVIFARARACVRCCFLINARVPVVPLYFVEDMGSLSVIIGWLALFKHWALAESPNVRESKTVLDCGFHVVDSGLFVRGTWISDCNHYWDPHTLCCIQDSKAQDSWFHKQRFPGFPYVGQAKFTNGNFSKKYI